MLRLLHLVSLALDCRDAVMPSLLRPPARKLPLFLPGSDMPSLASSQCRRGVDTRMLISQLAVAATSRPVPVPSL